MINNDLIDKVIYSDKEYKTNKICNGKPVYSRHFSVLLNLTASSSVQQKEIPHGIPNIETVIDFSCYLDNGARIPYLANSGGITAIDNINNTSIVIRWLNDNWSGRTFNFLLEYTKTTD